MEKFIIYFYRATKGGAGEPLHGGLCGGVAPLSDYAALRGLMSDPPFNVYECIFEASSLSAAYLLGAALFGYRGDR